MTFSLSNNAVSTTNVFLRFYLKESKYSMFEDNYKSVPLHGLNKYLYNGKSKIKVNKNNGSENP